MPKFQARHYVAVARLLHDNRRIIAEKIVRYGSPSATTRATLAAQLDMVDMIATDFQRMFHDDSAGFDSVRFYDAVHTGKGL